VESSVEIIHECALLACEILDKMDHLRDCKVEKGILELGRVSATMKRNCINLIIGNGSNGHGGVRRGQ
jgi:hypothetical protein